MMVCMQTKIIEMEFIRLVKRQFRKTDSERLGTRPATSGVEVDIANSAPYPPQP